MEASFSRSKLVTPAELKSLNVRSNLRGAGQMASHVGAILIAGYLHSLALGTGWVWVTGFVLGVLINFLYAAQHELSHATVFANRNELRPCCRTLGYFTPVRERGTKWDNIDAIIQTIIRQLQLSGYMSLVRRKAALPRSLGSLGRS
jgi:hypothetical protein